MIRTSTELPPIYSVVVSINPSTAVFPPCLLVFQNGVYERGDEAPGGVKEQRQRQQQQDQQCQHHNGRRSTTTNGTTIRSIAASTTTATILRLQWRHGRLHQTDGSTNVLGQMLHIRQQVCMCSSTSGSHHGILRRHLQR